MSGAHGVVLLADAEDEGALVLAIDAHSDRLRVVRRCADLAEVRAAAKGRIADLAVIDALNPDLDARTIEDLHAEGMGVVLLAPPNLADALRPLAADCVAAPSNTDNIVDALLVLAMTGPARILPFPPPPPPEAGAGGPGTEASEDVAHPTEESTVIAVWGISGAPGRSSIALGLAASLSRHADTVLIDADIANPSLAHMLGLPVEASSLSALARQAGRFELDEHAIDEAGVRLGPTLTILTGVTSAHRWREVGPASLASIIEAARSRARWIIVDLAAAGLDPVADDIRHHGERDDVTAAALRVADEIICVVRGDVLGLNRLADATEWLSSLCPHAEPRIVVNRVDTASAGPSPRMALKDALAPIIPDSVVHVVPEDPHVRTALLKGRAITDFAGESGAAQAIIVLAEAFTGPIARPGSRRRRRRADVKH